jgi:flagellar L-ring protein precursor FlgH
MKRLYLLLLAAACAVPAGAQDLRENIGRSLFADVKAARVGDAVTILIIESTSATNDARTNASRESNISLSASGKVGASNVPDVSVGVGTGNGFKGEGGTATSGSIRAKISARVDSVLANGTLSIRGTRTTVINGEEQIIRISGIVRPTDVMPDNSVYSYNVSEANIVFEGNGMIARAQGPGWITKLLHWLF